MANPFSWLLGASALEVSNSELPAIFPFSLVSRDFVRADILQTYEKILTDVAERTHGLQEKNEPLLWDSAVATAANEGLITLLACAMTDQKELFLVLKQGVLRKADSQEEKKIREDYKAKGESSEGVYISFKDYRKTTMLKIYSEFEYCVLSSLNKSLNVAKAMQVKISDMRQSVGLNDAEIAKAQGKSIATALGKGADVMLDAKDSINTTTPDTAPAEKSILFLDTKRSFILGLPLSYVMGEQTAGIGSTGEADMRAVERGLKQYFVSIIKPVYKALFKADVEFKTQDFRLVTSAIEVLKAFDLTSDENLSKETKRDITARVFDVDPDEEKKRIEAEEKEREAEKAKLAKEQADALAKATANGAAQPNGKAPQPGATASMQIRTNVQ